MLKKNQKGAIGVIEIALIVVLVGAVAFTLWRINDVDQETDQASQSAIEGSDSALKLDLLPDDLEGLKTIEEIKDSAQTGDAKIVGIELELEDGSLVYKLILSNGTVLVFDARTGERLADETEDDVDSDAPIPANFVAEVTVAEALAIAKSERPDKKVEKVELEVEDGVVVWSVRFVDDGRVDVNATTGVIERVKMAGGDEVKDDDNDEDGDHDHDDDDNHDDDDDDDEDDDNDDDEDDDDQDNSGSGSN